jgi:hypothetical protein
MVYVFASENLVREFVRGGAADAAADGLDLRRAIRAGRRVGDGVAREQPEVQRALPAERPHAA